MTGMDLARLREVAEAATPRKWQSRLGKFGSGVASGRTRFGEHYIANNIPDPSDAEHIATFDPPTVLALLDALASRDARLAAVEALAGPGGDFEPCNQANWTCSHVECETAVAVLAALRSDPDEQSPGVNLAFTAAEVIEIANETSDSFGNLYRLDFIDRIEHESRRVIPPGSSDPSEGP